MPAFKRDNASRLRDAERCMKAGEPLTVREASFISLLMGHTERTGAATVRFTMHVDGSLDGQIAKTQVFSLTHTLLVFGAAAENGDLQYGPVMK